MVESFWHYIGRKEANATEKDAVRDAISEINNSQDRAAAIVAAAFVEDHLTLALSFSWA